MKLIKNTEVTKGTGRQNWGYAVFFIIVLIVFFKIKIDDMPQQQTQPLKESAQRTQQLADMPPSEVAFIELIEKMSKEYKAAPNELKKSIIRTERSKLLASTLKSKSVNGWVGTILDMSTNSDRKAILAVRLEPSDIILTTWNNDLSDLVDDTLIPHASHLYNAISEMAKGQRVVVSGHFFYSKGDYIKEASLREHGSMKSPEFIFKFSKVTRFK
ncbi:MAG: hypothetical protein PHN84_09955 [Desulfuromonadaceae bacterium]|nr:hypothetical protein [Desulfuromonadaceae bacterium]MDD2856306.1 hypothetical protein [Desulfuromonadaceae bacterium]